MDEVRPRLVVFSTLFPHAAQPNAGVFIRERMFRVGKKLPITVVSPRAWFPLQGLIRRFRPQFRPPARAYEIQQGIEIFRPRFFSFPGVGRSLDGLFMAVGSYAVLRRLRGKGRVDILDAHFAYPDGYAATLLGRWLDIPVTITLRGTEVPQSRDAARRARIVKALNRAVRVFSVADALKQYVGALGVDKDKILVVGNGVDSERFRPIAKQTARESLGLPADVPVIITVGGLVERKGFHRVMEVLPNLRLKFPDTRYLIVGGASAEGDWETRLKALAARLKLSDAVHFLGPLPPEDLHVPLSAADVFVLSTRNEGWANVLLEAMACGLPVVTTDVGGNREVVCNEKLGTIVPFGNAEALAQALADALARPWNRRDIIAHARDNDWTHRVAVLSDEFERIHRRRIVRA